MTLSDGSVVPYGIGIRLHRVLKDQQPKGGPYLAALVDKIPTGLYHSLVHDAKVEFIGLDHIEGLRAYRRTLCFVLIYAAKELFPSERLIIQHSLGLSYFCQMTRTVDEQLLQQLRARMNDIIERDIPIDHHRLPLVEALKEFESNKQMDRARLFRYLGSPVVEVNGMNGLIDYFYGPLIPRTGMLKNFELTLYQPGFLLRWPLGAPDGEIPEFKEQPKLFRTLWEFSRVGEQLKVKTIGKLNELVASGEISEYIKIAEALHEKKIAQISDDIAGREPKPRMILISGPSASGKTTFAQRLGIHLRINGMTPRTLSLDNYFVNREENPRDEKGEYDFEVLEALDLELLNGDLKKLLDGNEVELPHFDFNDGRREYRGRKMKLENDDILIIEGIHGLNPDLTPAIHDALKFRIYVSALSQINIDSHNRVPTTDLRIIRRMVRDNRYRGNKALDTLTRWPSVRRGERLYIFPFQERCDTMFNSSLLYELAVLKTFAEPLLRQIPPDSNSYPEASRLLKFLGFFLPVPMDDIPPTSILREFLGGSSIRYHK